MTAVASGEEVEHLMSEAGEAAWVDELAPGVGEEAEEGLPFIVVDVEGEEEKAKEILRKARTGAGHATVAKGRSKGPGAPRAGVRDQHDKRASGAPGCACDAG